MPAITEIGQMLAGIAFILLAMNFMESSLRSLAGRGFKLFLKKQTSNKVKAIGGGAVITGILQSSSIVNLLVLSMAGAGVLKMENALALILGANLGTTLNSWLVALLGFNFNIEDFTLPVAGIAGIIMAFSKAESKWFLWFKFLFSLAFLFVALGFIKNGMEGFVKQVDLSILTRFPVIVFLLLGTAITTLVQSGSVTIAITLSALYTNVITLYDATAIVLGSEIGTTLKLFLVSAKGQPVKKRVALGNFLFNIATVVLIFLFLYPVNLLITEVIDIKDNLIALVFFQTFINLFCIILFFPFLNLFGKFLLKRYPDSEEESFYISKMPVTDIDIAVEALENETKHFITLVINYSLDSFNAKGNPTAANTIYKKFYAKSLSEKYDYIKQLHGEMHGFYLQILNTSQQGKKIERLEQLVTSIRNSMYAAKSIRDARHDIEQISNSSNNVKYDFYVQSAKKSSLIYQQILKMLDEKDKVSYFEQLTSLYKTITVGYSETLQLLYKDSLASLVNETEISTLINFNREIYTSYKSILFSVKDYLLTPKDAEYFDGLPGFIR